MFKPMRTLLALATALLPCAAIAQAAPTDAAAEVADVANNTPFGNWLVTCEALSVKRSVCRLTQELTLRDSGDLVVRFIALPAKGGAIMLAQVPSGVYLPGGAVWRASTPEDAKQHEMIWQRCLGGVCEAAQGLSDADLAEMTASGTMLFGYRMDPQGEPLVLEVDVKRFAEGIEALRVQMDEAELAVIPAPDADAKPKN